MHRPSSHETLVRALLLLAAVLAMGANARAFTLIELNDHPVVLVTPGEPAPADGSSQIENRPRNSISDDGRYVVFTSLATKLAPNQDDVVNNALDVFLYDRNNGSITLVSHQKDKPDLAATGKSDQPVISPDGNFVVFRSTADDIVPGAYVAPTSNIFLWDRALDSFTLVSHGPGPGIEAGDGDSLNAVINTTGRPIVAFESIAKNLATGDDKGVFDVFRFDSTDGQVILVSIPNGDVPEPWVANGGSFHPDIDGSGNCIVYESVATNLVSDTPSADDQINTLDVFRWKFAAEPYPTILLSHVAGAPSRGTGAKTGDGESTEPSIDDACRRATFKSAATNLASGQSDSIGTVDVFLAVGVDVAGSDALLVSHQPGAPTKTGNGGPSDSPIISRDGDWIAYTSQAQDLIPFQSDPGTTSDVFLFDVTNDENHLVSHEATTLENAASGDSFFPEISVNGQYVAYVSGAKDLDPNQNDGNGGLDVFLYNRQWNNSILVSRRYASIAITGNRSSFQPALSGNGYFVAFTSEANDLVADDPDPSGQADVYYFWALFTPTFLTARSTANDNLIEWVTPNVNYTAMRMFVLPSACPVASPTLDDAIAGGTELPVGVSPPGNSRAQLTHVPVGPGAYCYAAFLQWDGESSIPGTRTSWRKITGRTFSDPTGRIMWTFNPADTTALAQVGIGTQNHVAVANDGGVYGFARGPGGGSWAGFTWPFRVSQPIQGRPPVIGFGTLGAARTTFVGSQNGRGFAFDTDRVARAGGALWYTTPKLGEVVQPGASGMFTLFGGLANHILIGARIGTAGTFFALDASNGLVRSTYTGSAPLGAITGAASVDYGANRVYFTSFKFGSDDPSLWCLNLTATGFGTECWPPRTDPGNISGSPVQRSGKVYVGDDFGEVWAFDSATGNPLWSSGALFAAFPCGGGGPDAVKGFVLADRGGTGEDLYYATASALCAVTDDGSPTLKWSNTTILNPSTPILARIAGVAYIFVGSSDGSLYQIEAENPTAIKSVLLPGGSIIGPPAFDVFDNMIYVGSVAGVIYAVQAPF